MKPSSDQHTRLIDFLKQKESYPHRPREVRHIQTHISHVFMADSFVYKIKKPVDFGFLDYSTLEKRKTYCHREVELNRRLCEGVYLGVVPVVMKGDDFFIDGQEGGKIVEYAVKMNRLEEEYFLHYLIEHDQLTTRHLDRVAERLAEFYNGQDPDPDILQYGEIEKVKVNTDENFDQTEQFIGDTIEQEMFDAIREYTNSYYRECESLFEQRIAEGRIVDGHGDLHLDHIHITPEKVRIYDCIEFNERFRYGDLAADLAYLAMDLDFQGRWQEERYFLEQMARKLQDDDLHRIIEFYKCYRAYVKGKVKSLQSAEEEVAPEEQKQAAEKATRYFNLALRYATLGSEPILFIFMGRIGSGKSTLAGNTAEKFSIESFSSDRIRKLMAGQQLRERTPIADRAALYSAEMSDKTYEKLQGNALEKLRRGESVILDATFSNRNGRMEFVEQLEDENIEFLFVETVASDQVIKERLREREERDDVISDARLEDFEALDQGYLPPQEIDPDHKILIDTEQSVQATLGTLYQKLVEWHIAKTAG